MIELRLLRNRASTIINRSVRFISMWCFASVYSIICSQRYVSYDDVAYLAIVFRLQSVCRWDGEIIISCPNVTSFSRLFSVQCITYSVTSAFSDSASYITIIFYYSCCTDEPRRQSFLKKVSAHCDVFDSLQCIMWLLTFMFVDGAGHHGYMLGLEVVCRWAAEIIIC